MFDLSAIAFPFSAARTVFAALAAVTLSAAPSAASAQNVNVSFQGVIVPHPSGACNLFLADDGNTYLLTNQANFTTGDRVHVAGSYDPFQFGVCLNLAVPRIQVSSISAAFAGVGTITTVNGTVRLQVSDMCVGNQKI